MAAFSPLCYLSFCQRYQIPPFTAIEPNGISWKLASDLSTFPFNFHVTKALSINLCNILNRQRVCYKEMPQVTVGRAVFILDRVEGRERKRCLENMANLVCNFETCLQEANATMKAKYYIIDLR